MCHLHEGVVLIGGGCDVQGSCAPVHAQPPPARAKNAGRGLLELRFECIQGSKCIANGLLQSRACIIVPALAACWSQAVQEEQEVVPCPATVVAHLHAMAAEAACQSNVTEVVGADLVHTQAGDCPHLALETAELQDLHLNFA